MHPVAEDRLRQAIELRRALGDPDAIAGAVAMLGAELISTFRPETGLALLLPAVDELVGDATAPTGPGGVALVAQLSRAYFFNEQPGRAIEVADRALEAGERLDLAPIVSDVLITRGSALCHLRREYEGLGAIRAGIELADERGLVSTALRGRLNLGVTSSDPRMSFVAAEAALEIARRFGLRGFLRTLVGNSASAALEVGEWDKAVREVESTRDESPDELTANHMSWILFTFSSFRGEASTAEMERLTSWAIGIGESGARDSVRDLRAQLDFASGRLAAACDDWLAFAPTDPLNAPSAYFHAGVAALLAADRERAAAALAGLVSTRQRGPFSVANRRLLEAGLLALYGRHAEALRETQAVVGEYERLGLPWRQALAGLVLASLVDTRETSVRDLAASSRDIFVQLGARPFVERAEAALARSYEPAGRAARPDVPVSAPQP